MYVIYKYSFLHVRTWQDGRCMYAQAKQMQFVEFRKIRTEPLAKTLLP